MVISVRSTIKLADDELKRRILSKFSKSNVIFQAQHSLTSIFIKILVTYFQIVSSITSFDLKFPNSILFLDSIGNPIERVLFSSDCFATKLSRSIKSIYLKIIIGLIIPVSYILVFFIGYFVFLKIMNQNFRPSIMTSAMLFIFIYLQPNLISQMIGLVSCKKITGHNFIKADLAYKCYDSEHLIWIFSLILPSLLTLTFFIPLGILFYLSWNKKKIYRSRFKLRFKYIIKLIFLT